MRKTKFLSFSSVAAATALLTTAINGLADVTVRVDTTQPWVGYVNQLTTTGGYITGSAWGVADLRAELIAPQPAPASGWPLHTAVVLRPNTNTYNPANIAWNNPDGSPNRLVEANFYRDVYTNFGGQTVTFTGTILSNTIPAVSGALTTGWEVLAVIKEFTAPNYGWVDMTSVPITAAGTFTVSRPIPEGRICQYGFIVKGPNTAPLSANSLTGVGIAVEDANPAITNQPKSVTITSSSTTTLSVGAIGSAALTYQWKKDGAPLSNGSKYSGVTTATLTLSNAQVIDSGDYTVTVSNATAGTSTDSAAANVKVLDILVTTPPANQRVEQGSTVTMSVVASSASPLTYQWKFAGADGITNNVSNSATVSGATTSTLTISNAQPANSGTYIVAITTASGSGFASATLAVKAYAEFSNMLDNSGFEADPTGASVLPWHRFQETTEGSFGMLQRATDTYFGGGNVNVLEGTFVSFTTFHAEWCGIYQDVDAKPGQTFTADLAVYNPSGDPVGGPEVGATNESFLEIQFRAGENVLQQYISPMMNYTLPRDIWHTMMATNAGGYGSMPPTNNTRYLVAPPGTTKVRFQLTMHDIGNTSIGKGSLYIDRARLMMKLPASIAASRTGGNVVLSWKSQGATDYQVQYKDSMDGAWQNLGTVVSGTGQVLTKSDAPATNQRYYRILTL